MQRMNEKIKMTRKGEKVVGDYESEGLKREER